jgi:hypothetical protein
MYSLTIVGNVEQRRTEAEISDKEGLVVAVVYETSDGWHVEVLREQTDQNATNFRTVVDSAKERLSHYINRKGENAPTSVTSGSFSLWLMTKDDGTSMGIDTAGGTKTR